VERIPAKTVEGIFWKSIIRDISGALKKPAGTQSVQRARIRRTLVEGRSRYSPPVLEVVALACWLPDWTGTSLN
jgi:hypothetical protein